MNVETGKLISIDELEKLPDKSKYIRVTRDLSAKEKADMQISLYSLCGCGSGKKFKFCCYKEQK